MYRNKYFLEEINSKLVQCICGKSVRLDREYRERNLISHNQCGKCGIVSDKQLSTKSFFNQSTIFDDVDSTRVACCGLCDEKKKLFNEKFKENFSWKRLSKKHDELIDNLRCHAKWILDKISLCVRSLNCQNFTMNKSNL